MKSFLAVACLALALGIAQGKVTPKKNEAEIYKSVLINVEKAFKQMKEEKSECADCAISLADTVAYCIANFDTAEHIIQCVKDAIGTADACYPCVCDVLGWFGVECKMSPKKNEAEIFRSVLFTANKAHKQMKQQKSECADCAISLADTVAYCIANFDTAEHIIQCVKDAIGTADACYPCVCDVLGWFGVECKMSPKKNEAEVYKTVALTLFKAHIQRSECADCGISLADTIGYCIANFDTAEHIIQCVKDAIGTADTCYPCICEILGWFGIQCKDVKPLNKETEFYRVVKRRSIKAFTELKKQKSICADCALSLTDTIAYCIQNFDTADHIVECVKDAIGTADICYVCICDVLEMFGVMCPGKSN